MRSYNNNDDAPAFWTEVEQDKTLISHEYSFIFTFAFSLSLSLSLAHSFIYVANGNWNPVDVIKQGRRRRRRRRKNHQWQIEVTRFPLISSYEAPSDSTRMCVGHAKTYIGQSWAWHRRIGDVKCILIERNMCMWFDIHSALWLELSGPTHTHTSLPKISSSPSFGRGSSSSSKRRQHHWHEYLIGNLLLRTVLCSPKANLCASVSGCCSLHSRCV